MLVWWFTSWERIIRLGFIGLSFWLRFTTQENNLFKKNKKRKRREWYGDGWRIPVVRKETKHANIWLQKGEVRFFWTFSLILMLFEFSHFYLKSKVKKSGWNVIRHKCCLSCFITFLYASAYSESEHKTKTRTCFLLQLCWVQIFSVCQRTCLRYTHKFPWELWFPLSYVQFFVFLLFFPDNTAPQCKRQPSSWHTANLNFYLEDMFLTLVLLMGPFPLEFFNNIFTVHTFLVYAPTDHNVIKSASEKRFI